MTEYCDVHTDVELVTVTYCPICRASHGGKKTAQSMTAEQRRERALKAIRTRWRTAKAKKKAKRSPKK